MALELTASGILADLQAGLTRKEIGSKYGLNNAQVKSLFREPELKNKKTNKNVGVEFVFIHDLEPKAAVVVAEQAQEVAHVEEQEQEQAADMVQSSVTQEAVTETGALWGN